MKHRIKARLEWVKLYQETKNDGLVCRRCGISGPTLRKRRRFQKSGQNGLDELSRRPKSSPNRKIFDKEIKWVSELRKRRLRSRRIQSELLRNHSFRISRASLVYFLALKQTCPVFQISPEITRQKPSRAAPLSGAWGRSS